MKELTFSRDSWHFKLLKMFNQLPSFYEDKNLCVYIRRVLFALFALLELVFLAFLTLLALYAVGDFIGWIAYCIFNTEWAAPSFASQLILALLCFASVSAGLYGIVTLQTKYRQYKRNKEYDKRAQPDYKEPEPNFVVATYKTFKDKVCYKISFD